jgi:hypothetical protein
VAVERDAPGVEEAWIFFAGEEEVGGRVGEDGSTCSNVRFGIRDSNLRMKGRCGRDEPDGELARQNRRGNVIVAVTCTVYGSHSVGPQLSPQQ